MHAWGVLLLGMAVVAPSLRADCSTSGRTVRDWGLHRAWVVVGDCAHPERPQQLREIGWRDPAAHGPRQPIDKEGQRGERAAVASRPPDVRSGTQVEIWSRDADAQVYLVGTALGRARIGERVAVRVGIDGAVRHCMVRGPATVELMVERIER